MFFKKPKIQWFLLFSSEEKAIEQLPLNKVIAIDAGGSKLCIVRHDKGYFVTDNKCPHQALPLSKGGFCENGKIVCPFHRYEWDLSSGRESRKQEKNMIIYPTKLSEMGLYIGIPVKSKGFFIL
jgi:3-phenylpropionate/trans-cinnamate dioxygenase ferredoxin subunit